MARAESAQGTSVRAPDRALFDTNILIDYLNGIDAARAEIERARHRFVSIITWMEVLAGAHDDAEEEVIEMFLRDFQVVDLTRRVAREAVGIRRVRRIRLPDAIVWACARAESAVLVTRNTKDLPANDPGVRVPYEVQGRAGARRQPRTAAVD
jgi:predicted nucleic acid-binding protein